MNRSFQLIQKRLLATQTYRTSFVKQGGFLNLNLHMFEHHCCPVTIISQWQDHCDLSFDEDYYHMDFDEDQTAETLNITPKLLKGTGSRASKFTVTVPEYFNVAIDGINLDLSMINKIQGDVSVRCHSGVITVDKLRGHVIEMLCGEGDITVKKLIEGNSCIRSRSLDAKMINGDEIDVRASHVSIEAIYGAKTHIAATENITVGLSRGHIEAMSEGGNVSISGIDGSFAAQALRGSIRVQLNKLHGPSLAEAARGHIVAVIDPELQGSISCMSESQGSSRACSTVISDAFEPFDGDGNNNNHHRHHHHHNGSPKEDTTDGSSSVDTTTGTGTSTDTGTSTSTGSESHYRQVREGVWEGARITGRLTGKSAGIKRPDLNAQSGSQSGKIDLAGAEAQQSGHSEQEILDNDAGSIGTCIETNDEEKGDITGSSQFDITLQAYGNIRVETMSWIQIIRSKYGFEDNLSGATVVQPGRTASANINAANLLKSRSKR
mmetsp:Transcript_9578/g.15912  ORF Transcript_9578/g.15912 Transcript_9578/m.15912 type:complete len:493 (+) Transcript_9578:62-1540(+)